jgi:uncharacterized protein
MSGPGAADIIAALALSPHPEGGWYRQTWIAPGPGRPVGSTILFLLQPGEVSHWHRFDAAETWFHQQGGPLELRMAPDADGPVTRVRLGAARGDSPQAHVPPGWWQTARPLDGWVLVGCAVAPAFDFTHFELAAPDFDVPG